MVAVASLSLLAVYTIPANAVHDAGKLQLDGDAQTSLQSTPNALEDWDKVCPADSPASRPQSDAVHCLGGTTADRAAFIPDGFEAASDNIFKGGTDDADINTWQWKQAKPSPDKADIEHAFAAQYTVTADGPYKNHKVLYFGGDRLANDGNTNIGFWFFQKSITTAGKNAVVNTDGSITCPVQSGCGFTNLHTAGNVSLGGSAPGACGNNPPAGSTCIPGDIFILSAFTNGGAQPTIKVFEWVGPGKATKDYLGSNGCFTSACTLQPLAIPNTPGFSDNRCGGSSVTGDVACALVNLTSKDSPWLFKDKTSGAPANTFGPSELYEGGLDLTGLGFGEACFSSTLLNTRSSQSGTSVLQDFAIGKFGSCGSSVVTTPSVGAGGVDIGTNGTVSVTDSALVTVTGISSFSGSLTFHLCGPIATGNCQTGGAPVNAGAGVNPITANGTYSSAAASVTEAGRYCWRADFTSTTNGVPSSSDPSDSTATSECFVVKPLTPALSTQSVDASGNALSTPVDFGNAVYDTATLSGTANEPGTGGGGVNGSINPTTAGGPAQGSITFKLYGPDAAGSTANCNQLATNFPSSGITVNVTGGDGTYGGAGSTPPVSFTPSAPGVYHWKAVYSGDPPNTNASSVHNSACDDANEDVTVRQIPTEIKTKQSWYPNDTATISATTGNLAAGGTVAFSLYDNATCSGTAKYSETKTLTGGNPTEQVGTNNTQFNITTGYADAADSVAGPYSWKVVYTPAAADTAHTGKQSSCNAEHFSITYTNDNGPGSNLP